MTRRCSCAVGLLMIALLGAGVGGAVLVPSPAQAAQTVSAKVGKPLQEAQALAKARNYNGAIAKAKEAQAVSGKTAYEEFVVNDFLAYLYNAKRDYRNAIVAYEAALKGAPRSERAKRIKTLAELNYQVKNYSKTISYANEYMRLAGADPNLQLLVANCYYQERNYSQALSASKSIIDSADKAGRRPSKSALALYLSSAFQLRDRSAIKLALFRMVELYPSDAYWTTLIREISNQGISDYTMLDVMRLKLKLGLLKTDDDYFNMAKLAFALNLPGDAKTILDLGFQKKILGGAAGERDQRLRKVVDEAATKDLAGLPAADAAAASGTNGDADILVGQKYASYGQYDKAIAAITRGLGKAGVSNPDQAKLELGRIELEAGKKAQARKSIYGIKETGSTKDVGRLLLIAG